jgi:hypothetical protein
VGSKGGIQEWVVDYPAVVGFFRYASGWRAPVAGIFREDRLSGPSNDQRIGIDRNHIVAEVALD